MLKNFFRKPIVAVTSAVLFLTAVVRLVFSFTGVFRVEFLGILSEKTDYHIFFNELQKYNINFFELFLAVAFLMFFLKSCKENGNLNFPASFFRTGSIIGLVIIAIITVLSMALVSFLALAIFFGIALFSMRFFPLAIFSVGFIVMVITVAF